MVHPHETPNDSMLQAATFVEEHMASLEISFNNTKKRAMEFDFDTSDLFDSTLVDEELCTQLAIGEQKMHEPVILDSDDDELVELLEELKETSKKDTKETSKKDTITVSQSSEESLIMTQLSKEKAEKESAETLEMSQINWDDDPFAEDDDDSPAFDDDSFWETYDFDSVLKN